MSKKCPKCGADNKDNAVICTSCYTFFDKDQGNNGEKITEKRSQKYEKILNDTANIYKEHVIKIKENEDIKDIVTQNESNDNFDVNKILDKIKKIEPIAEEIINNEDKNTKGEDVENDDNFKNKNLTSNDDAENIIYIEDEPSKSNEDRNFVKNEDNSEDSNDINEDIIDEVVAAEHNENDYSSRILIDNSKINFPEEDKTQTNSSSNTKTLKLKNKDKYVDDNDLEAADKDDEYENAINVFETLSNKKNKLFFKSKKEETKPVNNPVKNEKKYEKPRNVEIRGKKKAKKHVLTINKLIKNSIIISMSLLFVLALIFFIGKRSQRKTLDEAIVLLNSDNNLSYMEIYNSLVNKGYSTIDIEESLSKVSINFSENALNAAYQCAKDTNKLNNKLDVKTLLVNKQFFDNEVNFVMQSIDWDRYLQTFVDECILKAKELDKKSILMMIRDANFSNEEITNIEKYEGWPRLASKNLLSYINDKKAGKNAALEYLLSLDYTPEEIDKASKEIDWNKTAKNYLTNILKSDVNIEASRNSFKSILESAGFEEEVINAVLDKEDFSSYAKEELNDYLSANEDAINKKDILQKFIDKGFNDKEVNEAMARVDWKNMSLTAIKTYDDGNKSLKELLDKLRDLGYSEEEIEYAYANYNWDTHTIYYIKNLIDEGKAGGKNNVIQLLTVNNYPLATINSSIKNFDFNLEALKSLNNYLSKIENCSKNKARDYLKELKYEDNEINYAIDSSTINWSSKAINFLNYVGYDSRISARNILEAQGYTDNEISSVINNLEGNGSWRSMCLTRLNVLLSDKDTAGLCQEHLGFETKNGGTYSVLKSEQYTEEEINYANSQINWPINCEITPS